MDTERTLALLQGLRACFMVQSLPVLSQEEESEKWLSLEIFSGGFETQPMSSIDTQRPHSAELLAKSFQRQTSISVDDTRSFLCGLMNPAIQNEKVTMFLSLIHRYCCQRNLTLVISAQNPDHPIERFGRLFVACLIKLHDLVPVALNVLEQEGGPNNEQESTTIQLPASLADICKLVYDAKVCLVKAHQESSCTYEEVCKNPIARCCFMIDNIRSPVLNIINILHKNRIQEMNSRWRNSSQRVLEWKRQTAKVGRDKESPNTQAEAEGVNEAVMEKVVLQEQLSVEVKKEVCFGSVGMRYMHM